MTDLDFLPPPDEGLFCSTIPNLPKAWDSTMLGLLKECPRKFQYVILEGWQPNGFAAHLAFGIAYHKALETYQRAKAAGANHDDATHEAIAFCLSYGSRDAHGHFQPYDAIFTREPAKTRDTLLRSVIWYLEHYRNDSAQTYILANGEPAVELSFKLALDYTSPDGDPFLLCGHIDRVVQLSGDYYFTDLKTSKNQLNARFWNQWTPNNQMSLYYTATQMILNIPAKGGIIDAVELGATFARFARHTIHRTAAQLNEWLRDAYEWITLAMHYAGEGYWPMNDKSCSNYGGCPFQVICSRDPGVRDKFMKHEGYHRRRWNPLENR